MLDGLIAADKLTNTSGTYHIKSAEQLAAFSALVNSGSTGKMCIRDRTRGDR